MIGTIDIRVQAAKPNFPLDKIRAFLNSPSSLRLRNVPREIGKWEITDVFVSANYPDNSTVSVKAVETAGIYVATLPASTVAGESVNGYTVTANGIDENGAAVDGYILGKGDLEIIDADGTITVGETTYYIHIVSTKPENPRIGDLALDTKELWTGAEWISFKASSGTGATVLTMANGKLYNGENEITQFSALRSLVQAGGVVLLGEVAGKDALFYPLFCDANAVRFDATGTLGNDIQSKSYAMTPKTGGGINISPSGLTELAKRVDVIGKEFTAEEKRVSTAVVYKSFTEQAIDNQAIVRGFSIPYSIVAQFRRIRVRGANTDSGVWDKTAVLRNLGEGHIPARASDAATMPTGAFADYDFDGTNGLITNAFDFVLQGSSQVAKVRIALVAVDPSLGFSVTFADGSVSNAYAPVLEFIGAVNRGEFLDGLITTKSNIAAIKEAPTSATQNQVIAKLNEIINALKK